MKKTNSPLTSTGVSGDGCCEVGQAPVHRSTDTPNINVSFYSRNRDYILATGSALLLGTGILLDELQLPFFDKYVRFCWFAAAYLPVAWDVIRKAIRTMARGDVFTEFFLMSLATLAAFALGEYPEAVAVMLFYAVGEMVQELAVKRAKRSIEALLKVQSDETTVIREGKAKKVHPKEVTVGETIRLRPGEKLALDGELLTERASFDTAALTGESVPQDKQAGEEVLAGMVNQQTEAEVRVTRPFADTKLSRILDMVQNAVARKAPTQRFISRFAKIYTPVVVGLAAVVAFGPALFVETYVLHDWVYRALVFLVVSCPCALVVSIPLGYFGGIGAASRHGLLFKGANFLDVAARLDAVLTDKTGTLTEGVFKVQKVEAIGLAQDEFLRFVGALEARSTHPIAHAVVQHAGSLPDGAELSSVEEIPGHGLRGKVDGREVLAGNLRLLKRFNIPYDPEAEQIVETAVMVAVDGKYAGYLTIADRVKQDAAQAVRELRKLGVKDIVMLSGDKQSIVDKVARETGITEAHGGLLPEDKARLAAEVKAKGRTMAFVGDGVNDAPVVAMADLGVAMGGLGSDATVETADLVIQTDQPSRLATAIRIGRATKRIVWQNIGFAFGVKAVVMALGAGGIATMWEAVFADVGVALLAILNAARIQRKRFP